MVNYKRELIEAINRTEIYKLTIPDFCFEPGTTFLFPKNRASIQEFLNREVYNKGLDNIALRCIDVTVNMKKHIE